MAKVTTVGDFYNWLQQAQSDWNESDDPLSMVGEFLDQPLLVPYHTPQGQFQGYGPADLIYDLTGLGFIVEQCHDELSPPKTSAGNSEDSGATGRDAGTTSPAGSANGAA